MTKKKPTFAEVVGARIRTAREEAGLSQSGLGEAMEAYGLKAEQTVVSRWELGMRTPSAQSLAAISRVLGRSTDYLLALEA